MSTDYLNQHTEETDERLDEQDGRDTSADWRTPGRDGLSDEDGRLGDENGLTEEGRLDEQADVTGAGGLTEEGDLTGERGLTGEREQDEFADDEAAPAVAEPLAGFDDDSPAAAGVASDYEAELGDEADPALDANTGLDADTGLTANPELDADPDSEYDPLPGTGTEAAVQPTAAAVDTPETIIASDQASTFQDRWHEIQVSFIEDPQQATTEANRLLVEITQAFTMALGDRQSPGLSATDSTSQPETEDLRQEMRRYRNVVDSLLSF
jgi:hypothetical protein